MPLYLLMLPPSIPQGIYITIPKTIIIDNLFKYASSDQWPVKTNNWSMTNGILVNYLAPSKKNSIQLDTKENSHESYSGKASS